MGGNGKTTVIRAAAAALGDYAAPIAAELLMESRNDNPAVWTAELVGLRFAYLEETKEDGGLRLERVKHLTGGGPLVAARKYGHPFKFEPTHTLLMATNHRPTVNTSEHAAWRRLRLIPFPYRYGTGDGARQEDNGLRDRVAVGERQREAMLAWIVDGAALAFECGGGNLPVVDWCGTITDATKEWRGDEDVIHRFIAERVSLTGDRTESVTGADLFRQYRWWCEGEHRRTARRRRSTPDGRRTTKCVTPRLNGSKRTGSATTAAFTYGRDQDIRACG